MRSWNNERKKVLVPKWFHEKVSYERKFIVKDTIDAWIINEIAITKLYVDNPKEKEPSLFNKDEHSYVADNFRDLVRAVLDGYEVEELAE